MPEADPPQLPPHLRVRRARWMADALEAKAKANPQDSDRLTRLARNLRTGAAVMEAREAMNSAQAPDRTEVERAGSAAPPHSAKDGNSRSS